MGNCVQITLKRGTLRSLGYLALMFFYVFDINFVFLPATTNVLLALAGIIVFAADLVKKKGSIRVSREGATCIALYAILTVLAICTVLYNGTGDWSFVQNEWIRNIFIPFFAAFFVVKIENRYLHDITDLLDLIVSVMAIQAIIVILSFFVAPISSFLISIQEINEREINILQDGIRAFGLGARFDFGAFTASVCLIIIAYLYTCCSRKKKRQYVWQYMIISFSGILMARSIVVGICISLLYVLIAKHNLNKKIYFVGKIAVTVIVAIVGAVCLFPNLLKKYTQTITWIVELFIFDRLAINGKTTNTLTTLFGDMYFFPENIKTWFVGDGRYTTELGNFYQGTDPLYMRYLLYWGVFATLIFLCFCYAIFQLAKCSHNGKKPITEQGKLYNLMLTALFTLNLAIYIKIDYQIFFVVFLLIWFRRFTLKRKTMSIQNNKICEHCKLD